jgi:type IV fimbrial biogenesis protein FimT
LNHPISSTPSRRLHQQGFTLVELVVTVALVAVLATLAFPSYSAFVQQWRRDSATRELTSSLQLARSEAVRSSRPIVVCPSSDGETCANATEWRDGWLVFVDDGGGTQEDANNRALDENERVLKVVDSRSGIDTIESSNEVTFLQFLPNGLLVTDATGTILTTLTVTPSGATSETDVNKIEISRVGRASVKTEPI